MAKYKLINSEADPKTSKGSVLGILTAILYLSPAKEADGLHNMCPFTSAQCAIGCLYTAGRAKLFRTIIAARIRKTLWYIKDRASFVAALRVDIRKHVAASAARGMRPAVRINGTSDQPQLALEMAREFPDVQFYDYTKIPAPWKRILPNYHLTFSFSGENLPACMDALKHGINVAVVFPTAQFPKTWNGYPVINGDKNDLRFLDPKGVIVGLKAKGDAKKLKIGGFVQSGLIQIGGLR